MADNNNRRKHYIKKAVEKKGRPKVKDNAKKAVSDAITKGETYAMSGAIKADDDNEAVRAVVLTSDVAVRNIAKTPSGIYKCTRKTIKAAYFTGYAAVKAGKTSKTAVKRIKSYRTEGQARKIAVSYINSGSKPKDKNIKKESYNSRYEWQYDNSYKEREAAKREERLKRSKAAKKKEINLMAQKMGLSVAEDKNNQSVFGKKSDFEEINPALLRAISSDTSDKGKTQNVQNEAGNIRKKTGKSDKKGERSESKSEKKKQRNNSIKQYMKQYAISSLTGSDTKEGSLAKKIVFYQAALLKKITVTVVRTIVMVIAAAAPVLIVPAIILLSAMLVLDIPPFSWLTDNQMAAKQIIITYEDRMREFGIEVDSLNPDDNTVINYNVDTNELRKEALLLYMAKKNVYSIKDELTEEDCKMYGEILSGLMECNMNINSYVEIRDGSLITGGEGGKYLVNTSKSYSHNIHSNDNGVFVENSCNEHGVIGELSSSGEAVHTIGTYYFIPCEVSQYSSIPVGTCLQVSNNTERTPYILMVVGKMEDEASDNQNLYLCGDLRLFDDQENPKFYNINTTAYGKVSFFSSNWYSSSSIGYTTDKTVEYTGLLDYMSAINDEDKFYNIIYRSPGALAEEYDLSQEEIESIFGKYYDFDSLSEDELEELKTAGIYVPQKEIYILDVGMNTYAKKNFTPEEQDRLSELIKYKEENEDIFDEYFEKMIGSVYADNITDDLVSGEGTDAESMGKYLADVYMSNGIYIPGNASVLAKYIDDNGWAINETNYNNLKTGDLIFMSSDVGTYKNITHIVVKVDGGFMSVRNGKITIEKSLPYNNGLQYSTIVMFGRIQ